MTSKQPAAVEDAHHSRERAMPNITPIARPSKKHLNRAPKGRTETGVWWRRHDDYAIA